MNHESLNGIWIVSSKNDDKTEQGPKTNNSDVKRIHTEQSTENLQLHQRSQSRNAIKRQSNNIEFNAERAIKGITRILIVIVMKRNDNWRRINKRKRGLGSNSQHKSLTMNKEESNERILCWTFFLNARLQKQWKFKII